ncbi:MAG: hypothetical protein ACI4L5_01885 [Negativibacillus sp.]
MMNNEFEKAFSDFLDGNEYDRASNALFSVVRIAFSAGWEAAGGASPSDPRIFALLPAESKKPNEP